MTTPDHASRSHALLSPSSADRWTVCTASVPYIQANQHRVRESSSKYADEGTLAHEVCEAMLLGKPLPPDADATMVRHAKGYTAFVHSVLGGRFEVEVQAPLWYAPGDNGHVDCFGIDNVGVAHVIDYKYGQGVTVSAVENKQLSIYARSILEARLKGKKGKNHEVTLHIYQPRSRKEEGEGPVASWTTGWKSLVKFTDKEVASKAADIQQHMEGQPVAELTFAPSDKACRWCPAKNFCEARTGWLLNGSEATKPMVQGMLPNLKEARALSDDEIAAIVTAAPGLKKYLDEVVEYATERALQGHKLPGHKLVEGRGSRAWTDEAMVALDLISLGLSHDEVWTKPKLISPAQAEELLSGTADANLEAFIVRKSGAPSLAPVSSKKKEWAPASTLLEDLTFGGLI